MSRPRRSICTYDQFFDWGLHAPARTICLTSAIDQDTADYFLKAISILSTSTEPIKILMNCEGGDEYHGLAIYDAIVSSKSHITIEVYGHAMSMGSWILQAADERAMAPRATMMLHYGVWGHEDHVKYYRVHAAEGERLNELMEKDYMRRIKQAKPRYQLATLRKLLENETFLNAEEAVALGLADRVMEID